MIMEVPENYELVCPDCKVAATESKTTFHCPKCGQCWPKGKGYEEYRPKKKVDGKGV